MPNELFQEILILIKKKKILTIFIIQLLNLNINLNYWKFQFHGIKSVELLFKADKSDQSIESIESGVLKKSSKSIFKLIYILRKQDN